MSTPDKKMSKKEFIEKYSLDLHLIKAELEDEVFCKLVHAGKTSYMITRNEEKDYRVCVLMDTVGMSPDMGVRSLFNLEDVFFNWSEAMAYIDALVKEGDVSLWRRGLIRVENRTKTVDYSTYSSYVTVPTKKTKEVDDIKDEGLFAFVIE